MKFKAIRRFLTGNASPQKGVFTIKGYFDLEDELCCVGKEHIVSRYRPMGLHPIGRFLSFHTIRPMSGKEVPHRRPLTERRGEQDGSSSPQVWQQMGAV